MIESISEYLKTLAFRSNTNLRPAGSIIEYTEEMINELVKCANDPIYFIEKYVKVIHVDRGLVPFILYPYQREMILAYKDNRKVLTMLFRQAGKTTTTAAFICWYILFNDEKTVAVLANKAATAREILQRTETAYEHLPKWMQSGIVTWNKGSLELENGSRVIASATSSSGIRGFSISLLYLDEFSHLEPNIAEEFFTAVFPTLSSGKETKILISSTPNGYNLFWKFWVDAEKGLNGFVHQRFDWWEHPERDQKWADEQRAVLGELKYNQEVLMHFLGSSKTLLTGDTLSRFAHSTPIKEYSDQYKGLKVYKEPIKNHNYVMTVDTSRGRHLDASAFIMFDVTEYPFTIAATYSNNETAPMMYGAILHKIAKEYNEAYILVEINDVGAQVAENLFYEFEYENLYWTKSGDQLGKRGADPYPGIRTTKKTKRIGCANIKDIIEKNQLLVNDMQLISEFSTFIQSDSGSYGADEGAHDDLVMCTVLFGWLVTQPWFVEQSDKSVRSSMYDKTISEMEEQLCPFGYFDNGLDDFEEHQFF